MKRPTSSATLRHALSVRTLATSAAQHPPHLLSLADLSVPQIQKVLESSAALKAHYKALAFPPFTSSHAHAEELSKQVLSGKSIALMFNKRSTRTRVASETAVAALGGHPMFLGSGDIQLGVNESLYDTSRVVSSMVNGIMARVGDHHEIEMLSQNSSVPVINALSSLYHPTQILADLLTLLETYSPNKMSLSDLKGLNVAWVGDSNNIVNDMIVSFSRLGINLSIATPQGYPLEQRVLDQAHAGVQAEGGQGVLTHVSEPEAACKNADVVVTDTWISMGQEGEKAQRMRDFAGFQVTMDLMRRSGAHEDWKFMHCLPRKPQEVDDEVFYSDRSLVFPEAENRKWTIMALFRSFFGHWSHS